MIGSLRVKLNVILSLNDAFIVVCNDNFEVETLTTTTGTSALNDHEFQVVLSSIEGKEICLQMTEYTYNNPVYRPPQDIY